MHTVSRTTGYRAEATEVMATRGTDRAGAPHTNPTEDGWAWAPYAPWEPVMAERWDTDSWAPPSSVLRPWVRLGRWTLLYRRAA